MNTVFTERKTIGDTTYIVENMIGDHARESAYEKIKRLILNDMGHGTRARPVKKEAQSKTENSKYGIAS